MVSERQKQVIRESWDVLKAGDLTQTGHNMFIKLLTDNPTVAPMFYFIEDSSPEGLKNNESLARHGKGVMKTLDKAVESLDTPEVLVRTLKALGGRHHSKGVTVDLFEPVGLALIAAMKEASGTAWTEEVNAAWLGVYGIVTEHMTTGLHEKAAAASGTTATAT